MAQIEPAATSSAYASPTPLLACFGDSQKQDNDEVYAAYQVVNMREPNIQIQAAYPLILSFSNLSYSVKINQSLNWSSIFSRGNNGNFSAKKLETKVLLNDLSGEAHEGEILAVLGPSGSGKSTLIDALANRISKGSLKGKICLNGKQLDSRLVKVISAYVMQYDLLFPMLTVEETLTFAAELRLPQSLSKYEKKKRVQDLIDQLDLLTAAQTVIGDEGHRGISGGERRRVSIGIEIIHDPILLFLDEPTSSLDSTSAFMMVKVLQRIAQTGSIVIMSIHQPSFRIFGLLDRLLFLSHGRIVYSGSPSNLPLYMESLGYPIPADENPSEAILDLICELDCSSDGIDNMVQFNLTWLNGKIRAVPAVEQSSEHRLTLKEAINSCISRGKLVSRTTNKDDSNPIFEVSKYANQFWTEISVLSKRSLLNSCRMPEVFASRFGATFITGLIMASLFWQLDNSPRGYQERVAFLAFVTTALYYICGDGLAIILQERNIMLRETSYNVYRLYSYWLSDGLTWIPSLLFLSITFSIITFWGPGLEGGFAGFSVYFGVILASFWAGNSFVLFLSGLLPDASRAYIVIVSTLGSFVLFCGVYITRDQIPSYWIWFHFLSLKKYTYEALMHNEYDDPTKCIVRAIEVFDNTPLVTAPIGLKQQLLSSIGEVLGMNITSSTCMTTGPDLLKQRGMTDVGKWECFWITIAWGLFFRILYYFSLFFGNKNKRK